MRKELEYVDRIWFEREWVTFRADAACVYDSFSNTWEITAWVVTLPPYYDNGYQILNREYDSIENAVFKFLEQIEYRDISR